MITQEQQKQGTELMSTLVQRAWESATFKEQLIESPVPVIQSVSGEKMKKGTKVVVEDQTDKSVIYLNIPKKVDLDEIELSDKELEQISGGFIIAIAVIVGAGALIYASTQD